MADVFDFSQVSDLSAQQVDEEQSVAEFQHGVSAIVVLDKFGIPFLRALPSLLAQKLIREIILVDLGAPDELTGCLAKIAEEFPVIRIISNKKHLSKRQAQNLAAKRSFGRYLMFVEQHAILPKDATLHLLVGFANKSDSPNIVSTQVTSKQPIQEIRLQDPKQSFLQSLSMHKAHYTQSNLSQHCEHVDTIAEGCFMIERSHFWLNEGLDTKLQSAAVTELCLKMHLNGGGVYQTTGCKATLKQSMQLDKGLHAKWDLVRFYWKHYKSSPQKRWLVPLASLYILQGIGQSIAKLWQLPRAKKENQEPSLIELLKGQPKTES